jgi:colanic acid/amylovoran biosynthesis glycosyltransferase
MNSSGAPAPSLKVAYLVNQYPHVTHSFIRREIVALEAQGVAVARFSIRHPPVNPVDAGDLSELKKTRTVLGPGAAGRLLTAVVVTALTAPGAFWKALRGAIRLGRRSERGVLRHLVYLAEACVLRRWMKRAPDIVHLHAHFGTNSAAVAMLTRLLGGPRYSFTVHGPEEYDHPGELSLGEKIHHAAAVVGVSDFGRSQLYRWIPYDQWPKVNVVHCGVDAAFLAAGPRPISDNHRMVCVGRLAPQKGQLLILEALAVVAAAGISFEMVLAGDGPMRAIIEQRIRDLGLGASVRITGWVSNDVVREELLSARLILMPSFAEGLPVALMEALALGRPAVTTYVAGIPELVKDRVNGWLIPAGARDPLVAAIKEALDTPAAQLATMGRAGATAVAERHDVNREAAKLAKMFRALQT